MSNSYKISGNIKPLAGKMNELVSVMQLHDLDYLSNLETGSLRFWQHYIMPDIIVSDIAPLAQSGTVDVTDIDTCECFRYEFHDGTVSKNNAKGE